LVCGKLQQREKNQDFISAIINTKKRNKHWDMCNTINCHLQEWDTY
jgi:hypothetical protein